MTSTKITYEQLQELIHSEYVRMGIGIMPLESLKRDAHFTPRLITELCAQYFLAGIVDECPDEGVKMIAHQYRCLNETGVFDVQRED